jgi:hypothetical protein
MIDWSPPDVDATKCVNQLGLVVLGEIDFAVHGLA